MRLIKELGLVLSPEIIRWRLDEGEEHAYIETFQVRACFTELREEELPSHCTVFGEFGIQLELDTLRSVGGTPVIYLPQHRQEAGPLSVHGPWIAVQVDIMRLIFSRLEELLFASKKPPPLGFTDDQQDVVLAENRGTYTHIGNSLPAAHVSKLLEYVLRETHKDSFKSLDDALYAIQALMYPTDDRVHDELLGYYRQREWRILGTAPGQSRFLSAAEQKQLLDVDRHFWGRRVSYEGIEAMRVSNAHVIHQHNNDHFYKCIARVFAPRDAWDQAEAIFGERFKPLS